MTAQQLAAKFNTITVLAAGTDRIKFRQAWRSVYITTGTRVGKRTKWDANVRVRRFNAKCVAFKRMLAMIDRRIAAGYSVKTMLLH